MVVLENEQFLTRLQMLYQRSKYKGTIRVQIKRLYCENFHHKQSKQAERRADHLLQAQQNAATFPLCVKAATPTKRLSTVV